MRRFKILRKLEEGSNEVYFDIVDSHNNNKTMGYYTLLDTGNTGINYGLLAAIEFSNILEKNYS